MLKMIGMYEHVEIQKQAMDGKTQWTWRFWFDQGVLWLDYYSTEERKTRRHKFRQTECYSRLGKGYDNQIKESDVPLYGSVKEEAIKKLTGPIVVKRWSERKK